MFFKAKVKCINRYSPERNFPERFKLNSEWIFSIVQGMYYCDGCYFTNNEFNHHFLLVN